MDASADSSIIGKAALASSISRLEDVQLETRDMVSEIKLLQMDDAAHFRNAICEFLRRLCQQDVCDLDAPPHPHDIVYSSDLNGRMGQWMCVQCAADIYMFAWSNVQLIFDSTNAAAAA